MITQTQATPKLQTPAVSTVATSNTNPLPPQVIQIPPNVLAQTPQPIKITNQAAPNNVQMQSPAPAGTMSRPPQRPTFTSQQPMPGSQMFARPQQNMPGVNKFPQLHAQLHAQLASMTPEKRAQYIASLTAQQPLRNNPQLRNALTINNAQISNQLLRQQNTLLQHELVASQQNLANVLGRNQLNLGLPLQNGTQINIGQQHFVTSAAPISEAVSTQALNGFVTSAALNAAQQIGAFNASTTPTNNSVNAVGYTTASTSVGTINTQFGNTTATNSAQLPASTMNSISTAGMTGQTANVTTGVIGQMATSINGGIRPSIPQKKINALWSGHIAWSANNNQGQKRELTCQVSAFPVPTKKTAPLSQID